MSLKRSTSGATPVSRSLVAGGGRVIVVWLAVAMIAAGDRPMDAHGLLGVSVAAAICLVTLRTATAGAPYVLGRWVPAAIGSTTGLVCVAALTPYLPGLHLSLGEQLAMWVGIFLSSAIWETVLERTAKRRVLAVGSSAIADIAAATARGRRVPLEFVPAAALLTRGPESARPEFVAMLEADIPFWSRRPLMKPGMTGWAQVRCGCSSDCGTAAEKLSHDFWYPRHGNLDVDVAVCLRTLLLALGVLDPRPLWLRLRLRAARGRPR